MVKFISYDGSYPNLCSGDCKVEVNGKEYSLELDSGGDCYFSEDWDGNVGVGDWSVDGWPEDFPEDKKDEVISLINENIPKGCCGGCL